MCLRNSEEHLSRVSACRRAVIIAWYSGVLGWWLTDGATQHAR
ncbi:MAG TPA: hypothetical protein VNA69_10095 [Thermoanaerobaculia bacterium]|nr:hypothetical protein [Thermoanaerobaculia bacterium]